MKTFDILWSIDYNRRGGNNMAKRKTHTSTEVKYRWIKANYKQYTVSFRYDTDRPLIDFVEDQKDKGLGTSEIFKEAVESLMKEQG